MCLSRLLWRVCHEDLWASLYPLQWVGQHSLVVGIPPEMNTAIIAFELVVDDMKVIDIVTDLSVCSD